MTANGEGDAIALRGATPLNEENLIAHLTGLMDLPHVGVLLGAGASKCAGGKLVSGMVEDFEKWLADEKVEHADDLLLREDGRLDLEATWSKVKLIVDEKWVPVPDVVRSAADTLHERLLGDLKSAAKIDAAKLNHHEQLLRKLLWSRDPGQPPRWIFSSNYDLAIELAAERIGVHVVNGFVGLHERRFEPSAMDLGFYLRAARGEARFGAPYLCLAKLHGSLCWFHEDNGEIVELNHEAAQGDGRVPVLIPPSRSKYTDTVGFMQGELFRRLAEFVQQPDSVLLVNGYALSDQHLNRLLYTGLLNPTFHLVLCCCPSKIEGTDLRPAGFSDDDVVELPSGVVKLAERRFPSVTLVTGSGDGASTFERFTDLLPEPALLDKESRTMRQLAREMLKLTDQQARPPAGGEA